MISVCMATFNGGRYLKEQLESILPQLGDRDEIIISDDASTDGTMAVIGAIGDARIQFLQNPKRLGYIRNFERALAQSSGDIIFLSDQDDVWALSKIQTMTEALIAGSWAAVVCDAIIIDGSGQAISNSYYKSRNSGPGFFKNLLKCSYHGCCMAISRRALDLALPFPLGGVPHDFLLGMVAELSGGACFIPETLVVHRRHGANASRDRRRGLGHVALSRVLLLWALLICWLRGSVQRSLS